MKPKQMATTTQEDQLLRNQIFSNKIEQKFLAWYRNFFSVKEIEESLVLQWSFGAILLTYLIGFGTWVSSTITTTESFIKNSYICWPHFQTCGEYYFLSNLPYGYSQAAFFSLLLGIITLIAFLMSKKDWVLAHMLMLLLLVFKITFVFFITFGIGGNFDYFDIIFSIVILIFPHKLFFLKLSFVVMYFLAATIKLDDGWVLGTYFTSLQTGLPLFPDNLTPLFTNLVIFMQIVGSWFLLSSNKILQRLALFYFLCFHFYSGIIVYYRYLLSTIPILLIIFGPHYKFSKVPLDKKSIAGWTLIAIMFFMQSIPLMIEGDHRMTLEGNKYGLYMFEANHQCISNYKIELSNGDVIENEKQSASARGRCDPYKSWFKFKQMCIRHKNISRISWQFNHSINGGPFYQIVDTPNVCELEYNTFSHNKWIKTSYDKPAVIGYPVKNIYY